MNKTTKTVLLVLLTAALLVGALLLYNRLSAQYTPEAPQLPAAAPETPASVPSAAAPAPETPAPVPETAAQEAQPAEATAADFSVLDGDGNTVTLSERFGKPIVVNFWATWCGPCRSELPHFDAAYSEYGDEIEFMMVNLTDGGRDTVDSVKAFTAESDYSFPVYYDTEFSAANAYSIYSIPLTVVIDKNGAVAASHIGSMDADTLQGYLDMVLE